MRQLGHDARQAAFAFGVAKLAFDGNAVELIPTDLFARGFQFGLIVDGLFAGPSQGFARLSMAV